MIANQNNKSNADAAKSSVADDIDVVEAPAMGKLHNAGYPPTSKNQGNNHEASNTIFIPNSKDKGRDVESKLVIDPDSPAKEEQEEFINEGGGSQPLD